ncbi:MAG: arginase family protein [Halobacteriovoraceae bacterium]|nr:arginase family protein [Halobacteriovoraceae bacterium]
MNWEENLKTRTKTTIGDGIGEKGVHIILQSPFDHGVIRNGGQRGARHAPQSLLTSLKKMAIHEDLSIDLKSPLEFPSTKDALEHFDDFQSMEKEYLKGFFKNKDEAILHLGGGHDHIYPFAAALMETGKDLVILNIDAHLDTRPDAVHHSGTPFRQLEQEYSKHLQLFQVGIHPFANVSENYDQMGKMALLEMDEEDIEKALKPHLKKGDHLLLSLDCDGLDASFMPAVSAPNHQGISQKQYQKVLKVCLNYWQKSKTTKLYGVYEYNPLFDDLAGSSARYLASTFYQFLK